MTEQDETSETEAEPLCPDHFFVCMDLLRRVTESAVKDFGATQDDVTAAMATTMIATCKAFGMSKTEFLGRFEERWGLIQVDKVVHSEGDPIH